MKGISNKVRFRFITILVGFLITLGGSAEMRATCNQGCNFGFYHGCFTLSGECTSPDVCEIDLCAEADCEDSYQFCVGSGSVCHFPSCSFDAGCCQ